MSGLFAVLPDQATQGFDGYPDRLLDTIGGIDIRTVPAGDRAVKIGGGDQHGGGADAQTGAGQEQDGFFHGGAHGAAPDIAFPAAEKLIGHGLGLRLRLGVEGILGDADAHSGVIA